MPHHRVLPDNVSTQLLAARYAHLDLFAGIEFASLAPLLAGCPLLDVEPGELVLEEGDANRTVYQIVSGRVRVALEGHEGIPLLTLEEGACFGELSILSQLNVSANVVALEHTQLLAIPDEALWSLIRSHHRFAVNLLEVLSGRLRVTNDRLRDSLQAQRHYARAARLDPLTGLYNRRWLDEVLGREYRRSTRDGKPLSFLMIDLDLFKRVNDTHGHLVGDEVLRILASRLRNAMSARGIVARFGGEEFAALLPDTALDDALTVAEQFRVNLGENPIATSLGPIPATVSIGAAERSECHSPRGLMQRADAALYRAKKLGRNCVATNATPP
ncbi:MAG: GGDEF domain-containing protein [Gammaproteobacteria bacterium]|nr:GGDEF domain-containing protein [Gammaproteobacteria bacterium]